MPYSWLVDIVLYFKGIYLNVMISFEASTLYFRFQTFSAWVSLIFNDQWMKGLRNILLLVHLATILGHSQYLPPVGPMGNSQGEFPRQFRSQRAKGRRKGSMEGGREQGALVLWPLGVPGVILVWPAGLLQGVLDRSLPWPQHGLVAAQGPLLLFLTQVPSSAQLHPP